VGLERGLLSLAITTEELLGRKSNGSGLESREYGRRDPSRLPRSTLYPKTLTLADKRRSFGRYGLHSESGHGVFFMEPESLLVLSHV
jgi:hypothetical protein